MNEPYLFDGDLFVDDRGVVSFVNSFDFKGVKRFYLVENHKVGFIRAWHGHKHECKYVYVVSGSALVGVVDMKALEGDTSSVYKYILSSKKPKVLYIPPGHANGFMNLELDTKIMFLSTSTLEDSKGDDVRYDYNKWPIWEDNYR